MKKTSMMRQQSNKYKTFTIRSFIASKLSTVSYSCSAISKHAVNLSNKIVKVSGRHPVAMSLSLIALTWVKKSFRL